jgi:nucleotide-binding universal stress UspA family protein
MWRTGRAHEQIVAAVGETGADLIVMGRDGETRPGRAWIGGVTQSVIGLVSLPVLVAVFSNAKESATP